MAHLVVGTRLFGRIHYVPGVFHIATEFAHVNVLPILPLRSWVVLGERPAAIGSNWVGRRIRLRLKSVLLAWLLVVGVPPLAMLPILTCVFWKFASPPSSPRHGHDVVVACSASLIAVLFSCAYFSMPRWPVFRRPSYRAAMEAAAEAGLDDATLNHIIDFYERAGQSPNP
jgi:hypothetical protein